MLYAPFGIMLAVTFTALGLSIYKLIRKISDGFAVSSDGMQLLFAVLLLALGVVVAVEGIRALRSGTPPTATPRTAARKSS
jgi:carbon starvation protein